MRHGHRVRAAVAAANDERFGALTFGRPLVGVTLLVAHEFGVVTVTCAAAHVTLLRNDYRDGFGNLHGFARCFLRLFDLGAASVAVELGRFFRFFGHDVLEGLFVGQDLFERFAFSVELFHLLFHTLVLKLGQLTQTQFQNVFSLQFGKTELCHQRFLGIILETHDFDHAVDVVDRLGAPFEDV